MIDSITKRLHELGQLKDGWYNGAGSALDTAGLDWLKGAFANHYDSSILPEPCIYPTFDGNVHVEWTIGHLEISLEVDLLTRFGEYYIANVMSGYYWNKVINLDKPESWEWLRSELTKRVLS